LGVTKTELARLLHVSPQRVTVFVRRGMPVEASGAVDPVDCAQWVLDNLDPSWRGPSAAVKAAREFLASRRPTSLTPEDVRALRKALMAAS
jgi:hypothetical protein